MSDPEDTIGVVADETGRWGYVFVLDPQSVRDDIDHDLKVLVRTALTAVRESPWNLTVASWDYYGSEGVKLQCKEAA